jgi:hypothetical protein
LPRRVSRSAVMVTQANLAIKRHRSVIAAPSIRCHVFANADSACRWMTGRFARSMNCA